MSEKKPHVPRSKWYSDGVPATDPDKPVKQYKSRVPPSEALKAADLKEARIEQIMVLMMQFATKTGQPTWNRKIRKALGVQWNIPDKEVLKLSAEAHKRVKEQVRDPEEVGRNVGVFLDQGLRTTLSKQDWNNGAKLALVALKMIDGPTKVDVKIEVKEPTASDAAQAVREMFGVRVSNEPTAADPVPAEAEPSDGSEKTGDPSKE